MLIIEPSNLLCVGHAVGDGGLDFSSHICISAASHLVTGRMSLLS